MSDAQKNQKVKLRFAPSPTGFLHVGGARTALFNYLFAKGKEGSFVLRIEDTDTERSKKEFEDEILESMTWLGLKWDEGPYYQSQRFDTYRKYIDGLVKKGHAYKCFCTETEVDQMRAKATAEGKKPSYDRRCRERTDSPDLPFCIRFKTPLSGEVLIQDFIKGEVKIDVKEIDDFVILRSNNTPIYNLTVVVDDIEMGITHVIRGEEHLNNTPKQILLMEASGYKRPLFAHLPLILAPDKSKLSKRHGAVGVSQYKKQGYLKEALINYLAKLGWGHGDQEIFSIEELIKVFDMKGCQASGAVFDTVKLDWFNAQYIKKKSPQELVLLIKESLGVDLKTILNSPSGEKLFLALRERAVRLPDFILGTSWYLSEAIEIDSLVIEQILKPRKAGAVEALSEDLAKLSTADFVSEKIAHTFKETAKRLELKMPDIEKPARVLLTGTLASPDIGLVCEALGRDKVLQRLGHISKF